MGAAADAYTGALLPDNPYETWAQDQRERFRLTYLDTLRRAGRWQTPTTAHPTDENAHLRVITALARGGHGQAALRQYERLEHALRQEFGISPSRAVGRYCAQLLAANSPQQSVPWPVDTRTRPLDPATPG